MQTDPPPLTTRQAAQALAVTPRTVNRWIKAGKLTAQQVPGYRGAYLLDPAAVEALKDAA